MHTFLPTAPTIVRRVVASAALCALAQPALAVNPFVLDDIRVEGLQRVEAGTVFASLPFRVGDRYTDQQGSQAIRRLFALGLFNNVELNTEGNTLVITVEERPVIAGVTFVGMEDFKQEDILRSLAEVGLAEGRPYDRALVDRAEQEIKRQYIGRSKYGVDITTTATPTSRNRVNLVFTVSEGASAKIRDITITGNEAFSESTLKSLMDLDTGNWLSWYNKSDQYAQSKFNADLEKIRSFYLSRGYLEFRIDSTQVAISPDKQNIALAINLYEGKQYTVSSVQLAGNYLGKEDQFKTLVSIVPGEPYNAEDVTQTEQSFNEYFANFGYAFSEVEAQPAIDRERALVAFTLVANPSRRAYVRNINIAGNTRTRDEVIRREMRQFESSWYDGDKIALSRDRIDRLGFFKDVNVSTAPVSGVPDQVDLQVDVVEKPTGNLQLGAGYSSGENISFTVGIQQENVFGSGNYLGLNIDTSKYNRQFSLTTTNPYFTEDGISRTIDVYYRKTRPYSSNDANDTYRINSAGASIRFGVPFSEVDRVYFGWGVEQTTIESGRNIPVTFEDYIKRIGKKKTTNFPLTIGWSRDSRDSALAPNEGRYQRAFGEWNFLGDAKYLRAEYQYQQYIPISNRFTFAMNGEIGIGKSLGGDPYPPFKNFYAGGLGTVRGFEQGSLGPKDATGAYVGGAKKMVLNAEVQTPFPGVGNDRTLRLFGFFDTGNVFREDEPFKTSEFRSSAGVGISWISPVGPLRLIWAKPIRTRSGDRTQKIQFQIGTSF